MLAACKAALSGLGPSGGASRGGGPPSPSDKQAEAFARAISEARPDLVSAHVSEFRPLLVCALKCHPARSTAWHLAAGVRAGGGGGGGPGFGSEAEHGHGSEMLELLLRLYRQGDLPAEGLPDLLNAPNKRGQTCLHVAADRGNAGAVRFLLSYGADLLRPDKAGRTAMHAAAASGSLECARLLLASAEAEDARSAPTNTAAAASGAMGAGAAAAGAAGADRERGSAESSSSSLGGGAAFAAGASGSPVSGSGQQQQPQQPQQQGGAATVSRLVSSADASGLTPLHFAAASNSLALVRLLLGRGASVAAQASADNLEASMPCNAGWTALHVAAMRGHYEVAAAVLRHHVSRSAEEQVADWRPGRSSRTSDPRALADRRGTTAASLASSRSFPELAALLDPATPLAAALGLGAGGFGPVGPDGREVRPPAMFICPITQEIMREPVVASDGFTYERAAIAKWMAAGKLTSPMTNLPFTARALYPNNVVMSAIKEWRQEHQLPDPAARRTAGGKPAASDAVLDPNNAVGSGVRGSGDPFLSHLRAHGL